MRELIRHIIREYSLILEMPKKLTQDEWISRANQVHKDKYDYSKVRYKTANNKVKITCPIHGDFLQVANSHLRGQGCPECGKRADTQQQFIEKAKEKHGDKFDYSKTNYKNQNTPIIVTCPKHGDLKITPAAHLNYDCKKCVDERFTKSPENFLKKAKEVHGDKYDYSKTNYTQANNKITVTCPKHGDFELSASHHIGGQGCKKCAHELIGKKNSLTQDEFIDRSNFVHNNKYDYSKVKYDGINNRVKIICPIHGEFEQTAGHHLAGSGCLYCGRLSQSEQKKLTIQDFIDRAQEIHGKKYDYSELNYSKMSEPVKIICPIHGKFEQFPGAHLSGSGCRECYLLTNRSNTEEFLKKAQKVHGDKFDYSKVEYTRSDEPVSIGCKKHGDFLQTPASHLSGQGCPICKESKGEILVNNILNQNKIKFIRQHTFEDCVSKKNKKFCKKLPFDFYIPTLKAAIEYDGQQHFIPVWGQEGFENIQRTDKIKNQYCKKNGIKLIRIPFTMSPEEVEIYLLMELGLAK